MAMRQDILSLAFMVSAIGELRISKGMLAVHGEATVRKLMQSHRGIPHPRETVGRPEELKRGDMVTKRKPCEVIGEPIVGIIGALD